MESTILSTALSVGAQGSLLFQSRENTYCEHTASNARYELPFASLLVLLLFGLVIFLLSHIPLCHLHVYSLV